MAHSPQARSRTLDLARVAVAAGMSFVLGLLAVTPVPNGGQVSLLPIPILVLAFWRGWKPGVLAGAVAGVLHFQSEPVVIHPLSLLLDYLLAHAAYGMAGVARGRGPLAELLGTATVTALSFAFHLLCGVLLFSAGHTGLAAWIFSATYNATYMGPQLAVNLVAVAALMPTLHRRLEPDPT